VENRATTTIDPMNRPGRLLSRANWMTCRLLTGAGSRMCSSFSRRRSGARAGKNVQLTLRYRAMASAAARCMAGARESDRKSGAEPPNATLPCIMGRSTIHPM
jgi:hypothetical protein